MGRGRGGRARGGGLRLFCPRGPCAFCGWLLPRLAPRYTHAFLLDAAASAALRLLPFYCFLVAFLLLSCYALFFCLVNNAGHWCMPHLRSTQKKKRLTKA